MIRQGVNMAYLLSDGGKRIQVETLALAIASGFLIPPAAAVIEAALIFCWAFAESILDVRELFAGGHVPLIKNSSDWQLSLRKSAQYPGQTGFFKKGCREWNVL